MIMTAKREWQIVNLIKKDTYITSEEIADKINVSKKTVQTTIKNMATMEYGFQILAKKSFGYSLKVVNEKLYKYYLKQLFMQNELPSSPEQRNNYVLMSLLLSDTYIKIDDLCDQIYVSNSTMMLTIKKIKKVLDYYNMSIISKPNYGIKIEGNEIDKRRCIAKAIDFNWINKKDKECLDAINEVLEDVFTKEKFQISYVSRKRLIKYLQVSLYRIINKHSLEENSYFNCDDEKINMISHIICHKLSKELQIEININEIGLVSVLLMGEQIIDNKHYTENIIYNQQIMDLVQEMLERIYKNFNLDFRSDIELQMNLCKHLLPLIVRLEYGFQSDNQLLDDIKKEYPMAFEIATLASNVIYEEYYRKINEDEIGYIAMSFALSLEKRKNYFKKNILLVCGTGMGSARLLKMKIEKSFKESINEIIICDVVNINKIDLSSVDYIFTTVHIEKRISKPIVEIPLFLNEENIYKIKREFKKNEKIRFEKYFYKDLFLSNNSFKNKEEAIKNICKHIVRKGYSEEGLYDLVMQREKLGKTTFGNLIAMPHPIYSTSERTYISVNIIDKPINWDGSLVQIIFLISISKDKSEKLDDFYKGIMNMFTNDVFIKDLIRYQSFDKLLNIVKKIEC